jgi:TolB-like protein
MSFVEELRRREVLQTAGLYAGGAWLSTEILLAVLDRAPLSDQARAAAGCVLLTVFIGGFPVAVLLAWFFDLRRSGVVRELPTERRHVTRALAALVIVVVGTAVLFWRVNPCEIGRLLGVAVLPCSYYGEQGSAQQGSGVARELNYRLSHLEDLRVPAWNSIRAAAARAVDPAELGALLGVGRLAECSVRNTGERLAINLQLFDTEVEHALWSHEYEGQTVDELLLLAEAFRGLIGAGALHVDAWARDRIARINRPPTRSTAAWLEFQRALAHEESGDSAEALAALRRALLLDADFARAQAAAARLYRQAALDTAQPEATRAAQLSAAWVHLRLALRADAELAEAVALRRMLLAAGEEPPDPAAAGAARESADPRQLHERALLLRPSFAEEELEWSRWLRGEGRAAEADAALARARALDPLAAPDSGLPPAVDVQRSDRR